MPQHPSALVKPPDLKALRQADADLWDDAYRCLWPVVFAAVKTTLQPFLPDEVDDVAIEALEEMVEKVRSNKSVDELKPLAASIAHNRAVSLLRNRFAQKRGAGKTESLDATTNAGEATYAPALEFSPLDSLMETEFVAQLQKSLAELKTPQGEILSDFYLQSLSYEDIATKHSIPVGSVGVYLKRGLESMRRIWERAKIV